MPFRIATWNVNSIRMRIDSVVRWLETASPDVLLMQETKVEDALFPEEPFEKAGYSVLHSGQKGLNGVAAAVRIPFSDVRTGLSNGFLDEQKRVLSFSAGAVRIVNAYVPNGGDPTIDRFLHKLEFLEQLGRDCAEEALSGEVVLAGDFNVAPGPDDVHDPAGLEGSICFHPEERRRFGDILALGFSDLFRMHNPAGKAYSWWDYRELSFRRNRGMRLDHILATAGLASKCTSCSIDREPRGWDRPSDHAPVLALFDRSTE